MIAERKIGEPLLVAVADGLRVRGRATRTIETVLRHLRPFFRYLRERQIEDPARVSAEILEDYRQRFMEKTGRGGLPISVSHVNGTLFAIKTLFGLLYEWDLLGHDPTRKVAFLKKPGRLPRNILTVEEVVKIVEAPDTATVLGYRDRTVLEVVYATAMRRAEVLGLTVSDVDLRERMARVEHGKGDKSRVVPLTAVATTHLDHYLRWVRPELARRPKERALFLTFRGWPLDGSTLSTIVSSATAAAGVDKHVTPHSFRHACATHMLEGGADIRPIQQLLGHRSLSSTEIYTHVSLKKLREIYDRSHPRQRQTEAEAPAAASVAAVEGGHEHQAQIGGVVPSAPPSRR